MKSASTNPEVRESLGRHNGSWCLVVGHDRRNRPAFAVLVACSPAYADRMLDRFGWPAGFAGSGARFAAHFIDPAAFDLETDLPAGCPLAGVVFPGFVSSFFSEGAK